MSEPLLSRCEVVHRPIRAVEPGAESPFRGTLCRAGDDSVLRVDARDLPSGWGGWDADPDGHVLAPLDVVRTSSGHDAILPALVGRVESLFAPGVAEPLRAGEAVTLVVSLLRGLSETAGERSGQWWLTDAGRPVLALDVAGPALPATLEILGAAAGDRRGAVWDEVRAAAHGDQLSSRRRAMLEADLFRAATPEPLGLQRLTRRSAATGQLPVSARHDAEIGMPPPASLWARWAPHIDADLAETFSRASFGVWRALHRPSRSESGTNRRRAGWLAAGAAGLVLAVGLLWPGSGPATATGEPPTGSNEPGEATQASPSGTPTPSEAGAPAAPAEPIDLVERAAALLTERAACGDDVACLSTVLGDPSRIPPPSAADLPPTARTVSLVDDYGGVAVLRVEGAGAEAALVVIERREEKWLLREISLAQQP